ncbi:lycopene cyclase domain-containing protein [Demequina sp. NBRC 110053]|uniref:lycopene cyclase domain-containing protein n=1 Tax=Demequina sp. NBRC 110053 TaxID=1570342 RepID=UPI001F3149B8|nr:lycopene cyclase domain-containing protein [Demequina sp. NBRC 110053]
MTSSLYLIALMVSLLGLGTLDWRYRLALFADARRTLLTVAVAVAIFLVWDLIGVGLGIFFIGDAPYLTGWTVAPEVPVEEVAFLTLLTYNTLLVWLALSRRRERRRTVRGMPTTEAP